MRRMLTAALVLALSLGTGWLAHAQTNEPVKTRIITEFTFALQPGVLHGFVVGPVSVDRGYVVEVSPQSVSTDGAHVTAFVQPEFNGAEWNDVLRVQLLAAAASVTAEVRVYALAPKNKD